ncbi:MAG: cupin domain-containing protein [Alphaproteobacteria bacterium]
MAPRGGGRAGGDVTAPANLLRDLPDARAGEVGETILARPGLRIVRTVSLGQASPPGFWYDQQEAEWVLLLVGGARLRFADEAVERVLNPGDSVDIAAHRRHRVEWTDPATPTVWLVVFHD